MPRNLQDRSIFTRENRLPHTRLPHTRLPHTRLPHTRLLNCFHSEMSTATVIIKGI